MILRYSPILFWVIVLLMTIRGRYCLRGTTLTTACSWAIASASVGLFAAFVAATVSDDRTGWIDLAWYATAVMLLCPGVAILGARRPGAGAWGFFVLLPLMLVLAWPALASTRVLTHGVALELEAPAVIGFVVVLVMAFGNWVGTKFTMPAVLYAVAAWLLIAPATSMQFDLWSSRPIARFGAVAALLYACGFVSARAAAVRPADDVFNLLWLDFVDTYGMVWSKRVMDRVNQSAAHEKWVATLDWHGFEWQSESSDDDTRRTRERIEHTLRWQLKRFVEPEWVDRRLNQTPDRSASE